MWPMIAQFLRTNPRYVALPFAIVVGFVGYNLEAWLRSPEDISSKKHNPKKTVSQVRLERQINQDLSSPDHGIPESPASTLEYRGEPMFDKNK